MLKLSIVGGKELVGVSLPPEQNEYGHVAKRLGLRRTGADSLVKQPFGRLISALCKSRHPPNLLIGKPYELYYVLNGPKNYFSSRSTTL